MAQFECAHCGVLVKPNLLGRYPDKCPGCGKAIANAADLSRDQMKYGLIAVGALIVAVVIWRLLV